MKCDSGTCFVSLPFESIISTLQVIGRDLDSSNLSGSMSASQTAFEQLDSTLKQATQLLQNTGDVQKQLHTSFSKSCLYVVPCNRKAALQNLMCMYKQLHHCF